MFNIIAQMTSNPDNLFTRDYAPIILALFIFSVALVAFVLWLHYRLFEKAGQAGWKAIVPIYNIVIFLRLGGFSGWWLLINLLPGIGSIIFTVIMIIAAYNITLNFNKPAWYIVLYLLLQVVWLMLMVLDKKAVWNPYTQSNIASKTTESPDQTTKPQPAPETTASNNQQMQLDQPQTPPRSTPPAASGPIQDIVPPTNSDENRPRY